jgi:raffinose/stachyose/melibiose transport system permease protein
MTACGHHPPQGQGVDAGLSLNTGAVKGNSSLGAAGKVGGPQVGIGLTAGRSKDGAGRAAKRSSALLERLLRAVLLFGPALALVLLFSYYPAARSLIGGFTQWDGFNPPQFVGLENFRQYFASPTFHPELVNVGILIGGTIVISIVASFFGAELVAALRGRAQTFTKYALALPIVLPIVIVVDIWAYMLAPVDGVVDTSLNALGIPAVNWLSNPQTALLSILLIGFPWVSSLSFLIFLGGIQRIPDAFREAASLDGASRLRQILKIDAPLVRPQFRVVVILSAIYAVQNFIPILILTNGGPGNSTMVPGLDMYDSAFQNDQYGYGMAIGSLMFVSIIIITIIATRALRVKT